MARIVAGIGVPHTPTFPSNVAVGDATDETSRYFQQVADQLDEVEADVLLMFDSDHLNTFFLDNLPTLSIGVAAGTSGPNDGTPGLAPVNLDVPESLAEHVRNACIESDFDVALTEDFTVDHSVLVPLHYLRPHADIPLLPVFINGLVPPLPSSARCWQLGLAVRDAIHSWPDDLRVAVLASGSFSLDVGGPPINPGSVFGVPDPVWAERVHDHLAVGDTESLVHEATRAQLAAAGNVGGELLNWIAMAATIDAGKPTTLALQPRFGHGYGFWRLT
jgi:gallate dioxygenase